MVPAHRLPSHSFPLPCYTALWDKLKRSSSLVSDSTTLAHIFHNLEFSPGMEIRAFMWWLDKGMYQIGHVFTSAGPILLAYCVNCIYMTRNGSGSGKYLIIFTIFGH